MFNKRWGFPACSVVDKKSSEFSRRIFYQFTMIVRFMGQNLVFPMMMRQEVE